MSDKPSLAIIGLGLIGGSLARALRVAGAVGHVTGYDPDALQCRLAVDLGVIDIAADTAADAVRQADIVALAVPVLRTAEALAAILPALKAAAVVTDVGSTKQSVLADVAAVCGELPPWFVAAHPIAGTEKSGVAASNTELFRNKRLILTPHAKQDPVAFATIRLLWESVGARVVEMDAERHDAIFAATSHLPHLLAYAFVDMLTREAEAEEFLPNAGGGFRDFTRIASSSPDMWLNIMSANRQPILRLLQSQIETLQAIQTEIASDRWQDVRRRFENARNVRERYLASIE